MRVIGGEARGRRLAAPDGASVRPTSDRVREAMFDILEARGLVEDAELLDAFAGSGAIGIEALSRGAASVTFVERDARSVRTIERNLESLGYQGSARVARSDVETFLSTHTRHLDLLIADPPYDWRGWKSFFSRASASHVLVEHREPLHADELGDYEISRQYRYGGTLVTLLQMRQDQTTPPECQDGPESSDKDNL